MTSAAGRSRRARRARRRCAAGVVEDRVDGVEPQAVDVEVAHPLLGVLDRPLAHAALRVVDRVAPERLVAVGEVGAERAERLVPRADVVVDDVEDHAETCGVRGVDEAREPLRAAVRLVRGVRVEAVVPPATLAGERRDRHQLDRRDAELAQAGEPRDDAAERSLVAERPDVELVDHELVEREPRPSRRRSTRSARVERRATARARPRGCQREQGSGHAVAGRPGGTPRRRNVRASTPRPARATSSSARTATERAGRRPDANIGRSVLTSGTAPNRGSPDTRRSVPVPPHRNPHR